jgi:DNA polymerase-3 subunit gamma/tau
MIETYIPLYRKYRPQDFEQLMGQPALAQALQNAITQQKVAHAYLFTGPRGTGKTSTARIFAKALNCEQGPTLTPCQVCASCVGITQGNALDVVEFDAASNNKVEHAREVIESARLAPLSGRYKIFIIDEVHMLTSQAFNALLKTLEEPPPNVVFLFATTEAHKVLPTILSRCQRFDLQRISTQAIIDRLAWVCQQEALGFDAEALPLIAQHAKGGLRDALSLLDQASVLARMVTPAYLSKQHVIELVGSVDETPLLALTQAVLAQDAAKVLELASQLNHQGVEPAQVIHALMQHSRTLLLALATVQANDPEAAQGAALLELNADYWQACLAQVAGWQRPWLVGLMQKLASLETELRRTQQPQLVLEVGLLGLLQVIQPEASASASAPAAPTVASDVATLQRLQDRLATLEQQLQQLSRQPSPVAPVASAPMSAPAPMAPPPLAPAPAVQPAPAAVAPPPVAPAPLGAEASLLTLEQAIGKAITNMPTRSLFTGNCFLKRVADGEIVVGCASETLANTLKQPTKLEALSQAASKVLGSPQRITIIVEKRPVGGGGQVAAAPVAMPAPAPVQAVAPPLAPPPLAPPPLAPPPLAPRQPAPELTLANEPLWPDATPLGDDEEEEDRAMLEALPPPLAPPPLAPPPLTPLPPPASAPQEGDKKKTANVAPSAAYQQLGQIASGDANDPAAWREAKENAVRYLQGKVLETY